MPSRQFRSFREFWPYYVAMHSRAPTRWVHLTGTLVGAAVTGAGATTGRWYLLPALPVLGYGAAWPSHWRIERNTPATFGHPLWSFAADLKMIAKMLGGQRRRTYADRSHLARRASARSFRGKPVPEAGIASLIEDAPGRPE